MTLLACKQFQLVWKAKRVSLLKLVSCAACKMFWLVIVGLQQHEYQIFWVQEFWISEKRSRIMNQQCSTSQDTGWTRMNRCLGGDKCYWCGSCRTISLRTCQEAPSLVHEKAEHMMSCLKESAEADSVGVWSIDHNGSGWWSFRVSL